MSIVKVIKIIITGNGPLQGEVRVAGAKNAALPIIAASLLSAEPLTISNIPGVRDIDTALKLLTLLGCLVDRNGTDLTIDTSKVHSVYAPYELVKTMRGAILLLGPLLSRFGEADVSLPGGCAIGSRPVNEHITGLEAMGAEIDIEGGYIKAKANRLQGAHYTFDVPSVTGAENLIMAATLAEGTTVSLGNKWYNFLAFSMETISMWRIIRTKAPAPWMAFSQDPSAGGVPASKEKCTCKAPKRTLWSSVPLPPQASWTSFSPVSSSGVNTTRLIEFSFASVIVRLR